jgi:hypothetical protein
MIPAIKPKHAIMREAALRGFSTATDLADYLVRRGLPFRDCHEIVGHAVKYGVESGKDLAEMSLEELRQFSDQIEQDVFAVLTLEGSVNARNHVGGTRAGPGQGRRRARSGPARQPLGRKCGRGLAPSHIDHFFAATIAMNAGIAASLSAATFRALGMACKRSSNALAVGNSANRSRPNSFSATPQARFRLYMKYRSAIVKLSPAT